MIIEWNKVTWYSKLAAVIFFLLVMPLLVFYLGMKYEETSDVLEANTSPISEYSTKPHEESQKETFIYYDDSNGKGTLIDNVKINQYINVSGTDIIPLEVLEDSRCPTNGQCVQAGTVRLKVHFISFLGAYDDVVTLTLNKSFTAEIGANTGSNKITLTKVLPAPSVGHTITPDQYRFSFELKFLNSK